MGVFLQCPLTFGGMWRWRPESSGRWRAVPRTERREVGVFLHSWCDAGLCCCYFILALAKTLSDWCKPGRRDTSGSPRRCRGGLCRCTLNGPLWLESSRGTEGNCIYRPVRCCSKFVYSKSIHLLHLLFLYL